MNSSADGLEPPPRDAAAALQAFEYGTGEVLARLDGLTDDEYLWEPVGGCWSVRPGDGSSDGRFVADFEPEADPPPFTTIAWRLWHITVDCLESYSIRAFGAQATTIPDSDFVGTAAEAIALVEQTSNHFMHGIRSLGEGVSNPIGPKFGPFAEASYVDLTLHAYRELVHHGAEIGVLRDLYQHRGDV